MLGGFFRLSIPTFSRDEAASYLAERLDGTIAASPEAIAYVLDTLPDYVPEFLVIAVTFLRRCKTLESCEAALPEEVIPAIRRAFLQQFDERLDKNYRADERETATRILDVLAGAGEAGCMIDGSQLPTGYQRVLLKLQYDNFIADSSGFKWRFSLNLIRQWWRAQRGME